MTTVKNCVILKIHVANYRKYTSLKLVKQISK